MFADQRIPLAPHAKVRPTPEFEELLVNALDTFSRDLKDIIARQPESCILQLAYEGLKTIREQGTFTEGHSQRSFVFMHYLSPRKDDRQIHISLHLNTQQNPVNEIGLDFFGSDSSSQDPSCLFRCYIRAGASSVKETIANFAAIKAEMLRTFDDVSAKWNAFGGLTMTGLYSEDPICVTALSHENYVKMEQLNIASQNPEDLARHVVKEFGILLEI